MARRKFSQRQQGILKELEKLARMKGVKVSYGKLQYAGLKLKPGQCLYRGETWLVMDRNQPFDEQVEVFRDAFADMNLEHDEIPELLRNILATGHMPATEARPLREEDERR